MSRVAYRLFARLPEPAKQFANRRANTRFLVGVVGLVTDDDGAILVLRHTYRRGSPWGLPSGWLKRGESIEAALVREIAEETGYVVRFERVLAVETHARPTPRVEVWVECAHGGGRFRPSGEIAEAQWCREEFPPGMLGVQRRFVESHRARARGRVSG